MFQAIIHGKARRVHIDGEAVSWRELFRQYEDLLTATIFERFSYLDQELRTKFLEELIGNEAGAYGELIDCNFWPDYEWEAQRVEPDVVLKFESNWLMIEVKRPGTGQYKDQWLREIRAFFNSDEGKENDGLGLTFLALGGDSSESKTWEQKILEKLDDEEQERLKILDRSWKEVRDVLETLEPSRSPVVHDMLLALTLYGISYGPPNWHELKDYVQKAAVKHPDSITWIDLPDPNCVVIWSDFIEFCRQFSQNYNSDPRRSL